MYIVKKGTTPHGSHWRLKIVSHRWPSPLLLALATTAVVGSTGYFLYKQLNK